MTEIWNIIWFCLTLTNSECMKIDKKADGSWAWDKPTSYFSEQQCMSIAEFHAEKWFNENKFQVEYACKKVQEYVPYVPKRRY